MADFLYSAPTTPVDVLTTQLNSLANNVTSAAGTVIDNTSNRHPFINFYIELGSAADLSSAENPGCSVYLVPLHEQTGSTYGDPLEQHVVAFPTFGEVADQRYASTLSIPIGPFKYTPFIRQKTDLATLDATGNTMSVSTYTGGTP